nr:hypothetical protein [uncultured Neokomagataea sp.]
MESASFGVFSFLKQSWRLPYIFRRDVFWCLFVLLGVDFGLSFVGHMFLEGGWHRSAVFIRNYNFLDSMFDCLKVYICTIIINRALLTRCSGLDLLKIDRGVLYFVFYSVLCSVVHFYFVRILDNHGKLIPIKYIMLFSIMVISYFVYNYVMAVAMVKWSIFDGSFSILKSKKIMEGHYLKYTVNFIIIMIVLSGVMFLINKFILFFGFDKLSFYIYGISSAYFLLLTSSYNAFFVRYLENSK